MSISKLIILIIVLLTLSCLHAKAAKYEHYDNAPDFCIEEFNEVFKTIKAEDDAIYEKLQFEEDTRMFMDNYLDQRITSEIKARKTNDEDIRTDLKANWEDHDKLQSNINTFNNQSLARDKKQDANIEMNRQSINTIKGDLKNNYEEHNELRGAINDNSREIKRNTVRIENAQANIQSNSNRINQNTQSINVLNNRVNDTNRRIDNLDNKLESGLATVTALTQLHPNPRSNSKTQIAVGTGIYKDNIAGAIGIFHWINNRIMLNASASYGGNTSWAGGVGLSIGF